MQNRSMTEDSFIRALYDVETLPPPSDIVPRLIATSRQRSSRLRCGIPLVAAAAAVWILSATMLLHPSPSYADVVNTLQAQTRYTITNTRIINGGSDRVQFKRLRDGKRWRYADTVGLEDRTISVFRRPGKAAFVTVDTQLDPPQDEFEPARLLWQDANPVSERNVAWNGRKVDIFREGGTAEVGDVEMPTNELVVDPTTRLPIRLTEVREGVADVYDFDYTAPAADAFRLDIPRGAVTYDLRVQRQQIADDLTANPSGVLIVDGDGTAVLLTPGGAQHGDFKKAELTINDQATTLSGIANPILENRLHPDQKFRTVPINGRPWTVSIFSSAHVAAKTVEGKATIGGKSETLDGIKVTETGSALDLLISFTN